MKNPLSKDKTEPCPPTKVIKVGSPPVRGDFYGVVELNDNGGGIDICGNYGLMGLLPAEIDDDKIDEFIEFLGDFAKKIRSIRGTPCAK
jgi:hypothetical protein